MKLLFCKSCRDIFNLHREMKRCKCALSAGIYLDEVYAIYAGPCTPLGLINSEFCTALENQPKSGDGKVFTAFVIPDICPTMARVKKVTKDKIAECRAMLSSGRGLRQDQTN